MRELRDTATMRLFGAIGCKKDALGALSEVQSFLFHIITHIPLVGRRKSQSTGISFTSTRLVT